MAPKVFDTSGPLRPSRWDGILATERDSLNHLFIWGYFAEGYFA